MEKSAIGYDGRPRVALGTRIGGDMARGPFLARCRGQEIAGSRRWLIGH